MRRMGVRYQLGDEQKIVKVGDPYRLSIPLFGSCAYSCAYLPSQVLYSEMSHMLARPWLHCSEAMLCRCGFDQHWTSRRGNRGIRTQA